jgi:hypothetical protein
VAQGVFAKLRRPENFASRWDDDYWKLQYLFNPDRDAGPSGNSDPVTGWRSQRILRATYEHVDRESLGDRRPVLLYGDSYAYCYTSDEECWQGLLARSALGGRYGLLNYGTSGFGLDQSWLMYRQSIELYAAQQPVVVIAILVDDDFDRCVLRFRGWPKPWFSLAPDGSLDLHPPGAGGARERFLDEQPLELGWYTRSFVIYGTDDWLDEARRARLAYQVKYSQQAQKLGHRILLEWKQDLERRGLEYFVLLFHNGEHVAARDVSGWRDRFAVEELTALGMPFVSSKLRLIDDARAHARAPGDYFLAEGPGVLHYNALGNEVVFEALAAGLERRFDSAATARDVEPAPLPRR